MAEAAALSHPAYAVCPRIERDGSPRIPKLFMSESAARRFLKAEIPPCSVKFQAKVTGLSNEQVRTDRKERRAKLLKARKETLRRVKRGELPPSALVRLQAIRNESQGWERPVPVCRLAHYHGPKSSRTFQKFFPIEKVSSMPALNLEEEIGRALEGRSKDYICYLDEDWSFDELEADAWRRVGHEYSGRRYGSIGEIVVKAIYDLEAAFQKSHPDAPSAAAAAFWRSWQIQRHIADFCSRLGDSETARLLAGNCFDGAKEVELARVHICRQLMAFAHELQDEAAPSSAPLTLAEGTRTRAKIEAFIHQAINGRKISRKDIWRVAGYRDATEFERYQREDPKTTRSARNSFERVLSMTPEAFIQALDKRTAS